MSVKTILEGTSGSRAYGTHNENSDFDTARVVIESPEFVTGIKQYDTTHNKDGLDDTTEYPLKAFMSLLAKGSFNQVEVLYLPSFSVISNEGAELLKHRNIFLTKEVAGRGFGFMRGMLNKFLAGKADTKDIYHFFRVEAMMVHMLEHQTVEMPLNDVSVTWLKRLREGEVPDLLRFDEAVRTVEKRMHQSGLPNKVDRDLVSQLSHSLYLKYWDTL